MRRTATILVTLVAVLALGATPVFAAGEKFNKGPTYNATTTQLTASGKATGLGNQPVTARLSADAIEVDFRCRNKGNNFAGGHPAVTSDPVSETAPITPRNGQITFSVSLPATTPSAADHCPNANWQVIVTAVRYIGVTLDILGADNNVLLSDDAGDFSAP